MCFPGGKHQSGQKVHTKPHTGSVTKYYQCATHLEMERMVWLLLVEM